jgi:hypothetical protein
MSQPAKQFRLWQLLLLLTVCCACFATIAKVDVTYTDFDVLAGLFALYTLCVMTPMLFDRGHRIAATVVLGTWVFVAALLLFLPLANSAK